jgi:hypothetical protein
MQAKALPHDSGACRTENGRGWDGARFTLETVRRYLLHDLIYHLYDVIRTPPDGGWQSQNEIKQMWGSVSRSIRDRDASDPS